MSNDGLRPLRTFIFGSRTGKLTPVALKLHQEIADKHEVDFCYDSDSDAGLPGRSYFAGENLGQPWDSYLERGVEADLLDAGLID